MVIAFILLTAVGSIAYSLQKAINAALGEKLGTVQSSFINHVVGMVVASLLLIVGIRTGHFSTAGIPFYLFLGGCAGFFAIVLINYAFPIIGAVATILWLVLAQLVSSLIVDNCGFLNGCIIKMDGSRIAGVILVIIGAGLVVVRKRM